MQLADEVVGQQVGRRQIASHHASDVFVGDLVLDQLLEVVEVCFADRITKKFSSSVCKGLALFLGEEGFAVVRPEGHQALARRAATKFSTFSERTWSAGTSRRSSRADALVERATKRRRASADIVCLVIAAP